MKIKRRIEIEVHTERLLTASTPESNCEECGRLARMLTIEEAARFVHLDSNTILGLVEAGRLHVQRTAAGSLLVCLRSLGNQ